MEVYLQVIKKCSKQKVNTRRTRQNRLMLVSNCSACGNKKVKAH